MAYRWANPAEWLHERINSATDLATAQGYARTVTTALDNDQIQDLFGSEMDMDGYFEEIDDDDAE